MFEVVPQVQPLVMWDGKRAGDMCSIKVRSEISPHSMGDESTSFDPDHGLSLDFFCRPYGSHMYRRRDTCIEARIVADEFFLR